MRGLIRAKDYYGVAQVRMSDLQGVSPHDVSRYAVAEVSEISR
jgi:hypothetical protein